MSEFDRSENLRRSFRRPRKQTQDLTPVNQSTNKPKTFSRNYENKPSCAIDLKNDGQIDDSHAVLMQIQTQINRLEFDASIQQQVPKSDLNQSYNTKTNNLNSIYKFVDRNDEKKKSEHFVRGNTRSTMQTEPKTTEGEEKKLHKAVNLQRSQSDTKRVDELRRRIKQKENVFIKNIEGEKVKRFETLKNVAKIHFKIR